MSQPPPQESSIVFHGRGVHGFGISSSSNFAVLYEGMQYFFRNGLPIDKTVVAQAALRFERRDRHAGAVAANDVYPIAWGGVVKVLTEPNGQAEEEGEVRVQAVECDPDWIADHVLVAFNPRGKRHDAPDLLARLFGDPQAGRFVGDISALADEACSALQRSDFASLASCVARYRVLFNTWTGGAYLANVGKVAEQMQQRLNIPSLEWKPPGAGGTESLIVLLPDREAGDRVIEYFVGHDWWVQPALVTDGVSGEPIDGGRGVRITAGHRIDFVGAADLGQDGRIKVAGRCCGCAIEPRAEILGSARVQRSPSRVVLDLMSHADEEHAVGLRAEVAGRLDRGNGRHISVLVNPSDNGSTADTWWVQQQVSRHGDEFRCTCQFGEGRLGLDERFTILAVASDQPLQTGEILYGLSASTVVVGRRTVRRTR
jgi:hypothetical protein